VSTSQQRFRRVGFFVAAGLSLFMVGTFFIGGSNDLFESRYTMNAAWSDVGGLKEGAVVRLAGWNVGEVTSITFSDDPNVQKIYVEMRVLTEYQDRIRTCPDRPEPDDVGADEVLEQTPQPAPISRARIETMGVLGDKYVALTMGPTNDVGHKTAANPAGMPCPIIEDGDWIETDKSLDIVEYTKKVTEILNSTASIGNKVDLLLGNDQAASQANLSASFTHLEHMLSAAKDGDGLLHALIYDDSMPKRVNNILAGLEQTSNGLADVTREIRQGDGIATELIYGEDGEELAEELRLLAGALGQLTSDIQNEESLIHTLIYDEDKVALIDDLKETAASLRRTTALIENGEGTLGMLTRDPALYEDMRALVRGAHRNKLLRAYIRQTVQRGEEQDASAWQPAQ
jgi:phospholipid/cholesterol/gamma-HCH transport system substrate-binding protein